MRDEKIIDFSERADLIQFNKSIYSGKISIYIEDDKEGICAVKIKFIDYFPKELIEKFLEHVETQISNKINQLNNKAKKVNKEDILHKEVEIELYLSEYDDSDKFWYVYYPEDIDLYELQCILIVTINSV